ncbi:unnamed protein product [Clavelina lepadiformis]|uniref:Ribosomal protein S11 n=1 Tax=Clavelina lepadiformis TaxID=159417 RepID=A0ABP0G7A1_CLALP
MATASIRFLKTVLDGLPVILVCFFNSGFGTEFFLSCLLPLLSFYVSIFFLTVSVFISFHCWQMIQIPFLTPCNKLKFIPIIQYGKSVHTRLIVNNGVPSVSMTIIRRISIQHKIKGKSYQATTCNNFRAIKGKDKKYCTETNIAKAYRYNW